jgi:hypothetical protein
MGEPCVTCSGCLQIQVDSIPRRELVKAEDLHEIMSNHHA